MAEEKKSFWKEIGKTALNVALEVSPYILCGQIFKKIFYKRTITDPLVKMRREWFPLLEYERVTFPTNNRNTLTGYFYHYKDFKKDKVIIFAHGYGNGHVRYLDIINYLASNGFLVFSYDMTSFDESGGDGIRSFPQGIIDLENAIKYVTQKSKYRRLPISLLGHSWGAYSISSVLNLYPKVDKVVALSGFNKSEDIVRAHKEEWAGKDAPTIDPYIATYEKYYFKKYADLTSLDGFLKTKADILVVHSDDDKTIPVEAGLNLYLKTMKDNPRFHFIRYKDMGHGSVYFSKDGKDYFDAFLKEYHQFIKQNKNPTYEDKEKYVLEHIDLKQYLNTLNYALMDKIISFIRN